MLRVSSLIYPVELVSGSNELMLHLASRGICCTRPISSRFRRFIEMIPGKNLNASALRSDEYPVRVLMFIPGTMMSELETEYLTPDFLFRVGHFAGKVDAALQVINSLSYHTLSTMHAPISMSRAIIIPIEDEGNLPMPDLLEPCRHCPLHCSSNVLLTEHTCSLYSIRMT